MAIIKPNNNTLSAVTALPSAIATGKVLQVIQSVSTYSFTTTSGSFVDIESASGTDWETAITPSATSSKILILLNIPVTGSNSGAAQNRGGFELQEKIAAGSYASKMETFIGNFDYGGSGVQMNQNCNLVFLSSPSTTSACTYKARVNSSGGTSMNVSGSSDINSTITLMEIAG